MSDASAPRSPDSDARSVEIRRPGEAGFTLILLTFSLAALWQAFRISGFSGLSTPGVFPMLAAGVMTVSGLVIVRDALRKGPSDGAARAFFSEIAPLRLGIMVGVILAYVAAMPWIGFMPASAGFLLVSLLLLWRRGLLASLLVTAAALVAVYAVFRLAFQVVLPRGRLIPPDLFTGWF